MNSPISPTYQKICPPASETKLCITTDSKMPIITKVPVTPGYLTLGQFKQATSLYDSKYKFYFKSHDSEFGIVKEELVDDDSFVPVDGDKVVAWVISNNASQSSLFEAETSSKRADVPAPSRPKIDNLVHVKCHLSSTSREDLPHLYDQMLQEPNCFLVSLMLDDYSTLGITVICPGDYLGVFVDTIQPNSAAQLDGRIRRGDRVVEINGADLRGLTINEAISIFKQTVSRKGAIDLVIQRDAQPHSRLHQPNRTPPYPETNFQPRSEPGFNPAVDLPLPVIDQVPQRELPEPPARNISLPRSLTPRSLYTTSNLENLNSNSDLRLQMDSRSVYESTTPTPARQVDVALHCGKDNIYTIYRALKYDTSSLDIRDREWLKVIVKDAFLGSTLVKWLSRNVYGFCNRSEVKRYANQMLNLGLIRSPMSNAAFSEKCYYTLS